MMNMKKIVSTVLVFVLCAGLCACGGIKLPPLPTAQPAETPAPTPSAAPETPAPTPEQAEPIPGDGLKGSVIVSNRNTEKLAYDPESGEILILRFSYDSPTVIIEENPAAAEKINEFLGLREEAFYTGEDYGDGFGTGYNNMLTLAEDNYLFQTYESETEYPMYELSSAQTVSVLRNDGRVLTLSYFESDYTGGAHGTYAERTYCFDPATGELITLDDLSGDTAALKSFLSGKLVEILMNDEEIQQKTYDFIDRDYLEETLATLLREGSWYLDYDGMVVFSDLYEISSYASGIVSFRIPYAQLDGHIYNRFLPKEEAAAGSFKALDAGQMTDGSTQIVDMLKVFDGGQTVYLVAEGEVSDVHITSVAYSAFFHDVTQLWSCSAMSDAALQLVTVIPDGMPNLKISWRTAQGGQACYLTQSGEDGSLILLPVETVEAVG